MLTDNNLPGLVRRKQDTTELLVIALLCSLMFTLLYFFGWRAVPFKDFSQSALLEIVTSLLVVSVFAERAVEAFLIPVRTPERQKIEQDIGRLKTAAAEGSPPDAELLKALKEKEYELDAYRLCTARHAYWTSFALGLAVSLAGVRALSGLVDAEKITGLHSAFFNLVDIVITGGVIAGGSAAIDKMGRRISTTLQLTSATSSKMDKADAA